MNPFLIFGLVILSIIIGVQILGFIKSKKSVGKLIPYDNIEKEIVEKIKGNSGLMYFYSPSCGNCKTQTPIIEKLSEKFKNIISIDASKYLKSSRAFNVLGTPSIVLFGGNKIKGYYVGVKSEKFIVEKLKKPDVFLIL